jgi:predicted aconitase
MLGWLAGQMAPDRIPLLRGLESARPGEDDLKALCAAFGTTSAAPMLHVAGVTPEADLPPSPDVDTVTIGPADFARVWRQFNAGGGKIDLVALGSPHFSYSECHAFADLLMGRRVHRDVTAIVTLGRATLEAIRKNGTEARLKAAGVTIVADLCWCSISEPVFPTGARVLMTNSGKYAHYAPGLSGRQVRFGSLADCARAAQTGTAPEQMPAWLRDRPRVNESVR